MIQLHPLQIRNRILQVELQQVSEDRDGSRAWREIFGPVALTEEQDQQKAQHE